MTYILGVNAGSYTYHDAAACVVDGRGEILAFIEEERLSRIRHAPNVRFPIFAVARCLQLAAIDPGEIDAVAVGWNEPRHHRLGDGRWAFDSPRELLAALGIQRSRLPDVYFVPHHLAHAVSAFYGSDFEEAAVAVVDGNGEDESTSIYRAQRGQPLIRLERWPQIHSLGHLYEAASDWLGLGKRGAGKTMGLAAYGADLDLDDPGWIVPLGDQLISALGDDARADYESTRPRWRKRISDYAGASGPRHRAAELHMDGTAVRVATAVQRTTEHVMRWLTDRARALANTESLCLAGGVGLNCAANGLLPQPVYVPPVPHDAGVALGAAWSLVPPRTAQLLSPFTGGAPGNAEAGREIGASQPLDVDSVAELLLRGAVVGICRGRSEVGPRALCHRSLLASPVHVDMRDHMNRVKRREGWRPFGPVTHGPSDLWKPTGFLERYMIGATTLTDSGEGTIPAVRHVDGTTRPQQLMREDERFIADVLDELVKRGHPPVLLNTSFNGPGEPIVETADQALRCAARLGVDAVVAEEDLVLFSGAVGGDVDAAAS
ncbi:carbamoyltransferase C-terminal domain-containing protein [Nocardia sp. NPDC050697]|uniref:carbamoyltransferase C-terminal domain-containing protein n=1 Tax=Nocardia sp. NPDC050697 TaxID=3155158 RepID=UPI003401EB17